jgi:hypothetical protein
MKVYAQYFELDGISYRLNTILQFGDSWELLGNVVLANPGSAEPIKEIDDTKINQLQSFYKNFENRNFDGKNWYEFNDDATMQRIEKVFNGWYVNSSDTIELNGVIQLFNTFNVKNQNLTESIEKLPPDNDILFSLGIEKYFNDKPTYFGFSNDVLYDDRLRFIAENIFNNSSSIVKTVYNKEFDKNSFYHPTFINRSYKRDFFYNYKENVLKPFKELIKN